MRILIDDQDNILPDGGVPDLIARNFATGLFILNYVMTDEDELYVDHDLGDKVEDHTGYRLMTILEEGIQAGSSFYLPKKIECVSDNGPGLLRIRQVIKNLYEGRDNGSQDEVETESEGKDQEAEEVRPRIEEAT